MKLYEVNQAIESIVDSMVDVETGEILLESEELMEQLNALQMERQRILEYLAKLVLNARAEAAALKSEEVRLKARRDRLSSKEARLLEILERECDGVKTDLGVATVAYRKTEKVDVTDAALALSWLTENGHADCFRIPQPEINKTETKKLLKAGCQVPGVALVGGLSCSLR